jgi:hypothetical protein
MSAYREPAEMPKEEPMKEEMSNNEVTIWVTKAVVLSALVIIALLCVTGISCEYIDRRADVAKTQIIGKVQTPAAAPAAAAK